MTFFVISPVFISEQIVSVSKMPRNYAKKPGCRNYKNYDQQSVEHALQKIIDEGWSFRKASTTYRIPFGTLYNRYHGLHIKKSGGQTAFSLEEEKQLIRCATICGEWGFPLSLTDLRQLAKNWLDSQGRTIEKFSNNLPGPDWVYSLLKRHKTELTQRLAANIKRARADVSRDVLNKYFDNLQETIEGIPASHVFNYDETNLQDDPGRKKLLYSRGVKYPERVCNFTKTATSIMMCGSASGVLLPPYIIYRAEKMWTQWTEGGPKGPPCCNKKCCASGARYNRTSHGWIDAPTFSDWFTSTFLPHAKLLEGRKILIGDNLGSHFTEDVIRLCEENNIGFVCLPKNATHLCQPLDVGFFRPFKLAWRQTLIDWKKNHPSLTSIDKKDFPHLLQATLLLMNSKTVKEEGQLPIEHNLRSAFASTGIVPLNRTKVLDKLPREVVEGQTENILVDYLKQQRYSGTPSRRSKKRTKLVVEPGKSVAAAAESSSSESDVNEPTTQDLSNDNVENIMESLQDNEETEYLEVNMEDIKSGTFLLVKVMGGVRKTVVFRYVVLVQNINEDEEIEVQGLKSTDITKRKFKLAENDEFLVELSDVLAMLPTPDVLQAEEGIIYSFINRVDVKEV